MVDVQRGLDHASQRLHQPRPVQGLLLQLRLVRKRRRISWLQSVMLGHRDRKTNAHVRARRVVRAFSPKRSAAVQSRCLFLIFVLLLLCSDLFFCWQSTAQRAAPLLRRRARPASRAASSRPATAAPDGWRRAPAPRRPLIHARRIPQVATPAARPPAHTTAVRRNQRSNDGCVYVCCG